MVLGANIPEIHYWILHIPISLDQVGAQKQQLILSRKLEQWYYVHVVQFIWGLLAQLHVVVDVVASNHVS